MDSLKNVSVYYQNVRGLRTKTNFFFRNITLAEYDIVCLTETWLLPGIYDSELFDSRYNVYRCDRDYTSRGDQFGGGVLIAVRKDLSIYSFEVMSMPGAAAEVVQVLIKIKHSSRTELLRILCGYFPHCNLQFDSLCSFFENVSDIILNNPSDHCLVLGDFNIPSAPWYRDGLEVLLNMSAKDCDNLTEALHSFLTLTNLKQFNDIFNINNRILDLVISDKDCLVSRCTEPLVNEDAHHPALVVSVQSLSMRLLRSVPRTVPLFGRGDYDQINSAIMSIDWQFLHGCGDIDMAVGRFYETINDVISKHIPTKTFKCDERHPPWFSSALIKIIKEKLRYHKKWKIYHRQSDYDTFSLLRERQKRVQRECYDKFILNAEHKIKIDSKYFWKFVKSKKGHSGLPDTMFYNETISTDGKDICNLFNNYFHSVFEPSVPDPPLARPISDSNVLKVISSIDIPVDLVEKYLSSLDTTKGCGPDGIPPIFLKFCSKSLAYPLCILFNFSLVTGKMPEIWKQCHVVPIFKSGDKHNVQNYRPISKISTIPKLFEKIIYDIIFPLLRPVIVDQQHGFVNKRSTETNLCEFVHRVTAAMAQGYQVDAVYTDYSKAFDKIPHSILIKKIGDIGIHGDLLRWFESYLKQRSQAVTIKGFCSSFVPVSSGVPQGSHLGPLLFNLFINDIASIFKNTDILIYADDMKIFKQIKSPDDCILLQDDLDKLCSYCNINHLTLNTKKCNSISFSRKLKPIDHYYHLNNVVLKRVEQIRDLGVHLDSKLTFKTHMDIITAKAYRMLGFVLRTGRDFKLCSTLLLLYNSYVRSILEYASSVWNPQYKVHIDAIEKINKKFEKHLRFKAAKFGENPPNVPSLLDRRIEKDQIFLYKILNNHVDSSFLLSNIGFRCPRTGSRSTKLFSVPLTRTKYARNSFVPRSCREYDNMYNMIDIFNSSLPSCKKQVRQQCSNNSM